MIKFAILGAGNIAQKMAATVSGMHEDDIELYAVAARDKKRAEDFASQYGIKKAYASYEEMLGDKEIDLVYIATPHPYHFPHMKMCLEVGKHVICEKPFTVTEGEAKEIYKLAEEKNLLCTEAIWTRYMPSRKMIDDIINSGEIGKVTSLTANLGYELSWLDRIWDKNLAGGALLDVGVYLIHFARMILGTKVKNVMSNAVMTEGGVDVMDSITMTFENGEQAVMHASVQAILNRNASIFGTKGYIEIDNINNPQKISVFDEEYNLKTVHNVPEQITGYEYEIRSCINAIKNGLIHCQEISPEETMAVIKTMDDMREKWGYEIPKLKV